MSTGAIVALAIIAALILILFVAVLPRMRRASAERKLQARRREIAGRHREEAESREAHAQLAEREAQRARAEAELHEHEAELHERGLVDPDDERAGRFERPPAIERDQAYANDADDAPRRVR